MNIINNSKALSIPVFDTWEEMLPVLRGLMEGALLPNSGNQDVAESAIRITDIITVYHNQRLLRGLDSKE